MKLEEIKKKFEIEKEKPAERNDFHSYREEDWFLGFDKRDCCVTVIV